MHAFLLEEIHRTRPMSPDGITELIALGPVYTIKPPSRTWAAEALPGRQALPDLVLPDPPGLAEVRG